MSKSQIKANPTKATLDAVEHEQDLETQRQKRKDSAVEIVNNANAKRLAGKDDGNKSTSDIPSDIKGDDYMFREAKAQIGKKKGTNNSGEMPSPLNE